MLKNSYRFTESGIQYDYAASTTLNLRKYICLVCVDQMSNIFHCKQYTPTSIQLDTWMNPQMPRMFKVLTNKAIYTWLPQTLCRAHCRWAIRLRSRIPSTPPPIQSPLMSGNVFTDSHDLSSEVSLFPFIFWGRQTKRLSVSPPSALRPMYTYLSPTSTIQSFFGRPPAHIHPPLTFSLRVNLLFSLLHKGSYKCHIVIATMFAIPHTAVLQFGLSLVFHPACYTSVVLLPHATTLATCQRKIILNFLNYVTTDWRTWKKPSTQFSGVLNLFTDTR